MTGDADRPSPIAGYIGFAMGALALLLVVLQVSAGPFAPQQAASVTVGEIAADIVKSAARAMRDAPQPPPEAPGWDIDRMIAMAVGVLAALGTVLGVLALIRHEPRRPALAALGIGSVAVSLQFFIWALALIAGVILLCAIIANLDSILGG